MVSTRKKSTRMKLLKTYNMLTQVILRLLRIGLIVCLGGPLFTFATDFSGTGFFVSEDGFIVTNHHVIDGADEITVRDSTGNFSKAITVLRDKANDIAVIKVIGQGFPTLAIGKSSDVKKGASVFTIGFPNATIQGRESKVTTGVISSLSGIKGEPNSFQISVPIQPGNSGGPLIDFTGAVIGLTTSNFHDSRASHP